MLGSPDRDRVARRVRREQLQRLRFSDTEADTTTTPTGTGSSDSDFAKLVADASKERFKITYTTGSGSADQTYAQDGKGNSVYGSADSQYFTSASGSVSCNTDSNGKATCLQVPGGATVNPFLTLFQAGKSYIDALGGRYGDVSSKTIAGRDAKCLTISVGSGRAQGLGGVLRRQGHRRLARESPAREPPARTRRASP